MLTELQMHIAQQLARAILYLFTCLCLDSRVMGNWVNTVTMATSNNLYTNSGMSELCIFRFASGTYSLLNLHTWTQNILVVSDPISSFQLPRDLNPILFKHQPIGKKI